jgi:hypothetical protein
MSDASPSSSASVAIPLSRRKNPYVGPRPFRAGELFFGREREAASVVNSLLSGRILLLHSPSGAGKTSLIQTRIVPEFQKRNFLVCAGTEKSATSNPRTAADLGFTALRVNLPPPEEKDVKVSNRYVFSVVNGLIGSFTDRKRAFNMTLAGAVEEFARYHDSQQRQLLVLDQLEEVLTLNPGDVEGKITFFRQLGEALENDRRWALLAIREDYIGSLDRFRQYLPGQLRATSRLDFLDVKGALRAVQEPTQASGIEFCDDAARTLVDDLQGLDSSHAAEQVPAIKYPYIEPVLLQVVCDGLFRKLSKSRGNDFRAITLKDVENFRPFEKSISKYYRSVIDEAKEVILAEAAEKDRDIEKALRDWVEHGLISQQRMRNQTRQKPPVPEPDAVLSAMQGRYLIRDDPRPGGSPLFELSHDMLVGPILQDNRAWRTEKLAEWQVRAEDWRASSHDRVYLMRGARYLTARSHRQGPGLTETEQQYLQACSDEYGRLVMLIAQRGLIAALMLSLVANIVFVVLLIWR